MSRDNVHINWKHSISSHKDDRNERKSKYSNDSKKRYDKEDRLSRYEDLKKLKHRDDRHKSDSGKNRRKSSDIYEDRKSSKNKKSKDKHKKKSRRSSSSSSSSSSSVSADLTQIEEIKLLQRLTEERRRAAEERKRLKELAKANETPEEKRLRRLLKKEAKERKRKEQMGWDNDYLHYTNADNPFGDGNLLATFVWEKKMEKDGLRNASREELERRNQMKMLENKRELEKVKKRRLERELEQAQREEEMSRLQRNKEAAQFQEWERQEDQFHLEQARLRSKIRIQDGRAKPIDLLAKYINSEDDIDAVEMHEPYIYLNGLSTSDLEDLLADIKIYIEMERGKNLDYWNDITVIVEDELNRLRKLDRQREHNGVGRREGIHQSVESDVVSVFRGKSVAQLEQLKKQIELKISSTKEGIDIGYWESLLSQLRAHMARARLRDRHQECLRKKLENLKKTQEPLVKSDENEEVEDADGKNHAEVKDEPQEEEKPLPILKCTEDDSDDEDDDEDCEEYDSALYSPQYIDEDSLEPGVVILDEEEDATRLSFARMRVQKGIAEAEPPALSKQESGFRKEARKGMTGEEAEFSVESTLEPQTYLWSDKYRPRKPRYFNRVHTGFEWNKYNQTHYDMDNPPPKIVQGYKFNIFYPDLIDKSVTPEYYLTQCPDNPDFAVLRFHAGPPYEDIAFKVVHREWEYSYKKGFRCQFQNNIFQLWFHFKRYRYRR